MNWLDFELLNNPAMLHAAVVHFPIALAILGFPLVFLCAVATMERETLRWITTASYALLTLLAYVILETGESAQAALPRDVPKEIWDIVDQHEYMANQIWIFAAVTTGLLALSVFRIRWLRLTLMALAMLSSLATGIWVGLTAHYGGTLVYKYALGPRPAAETPAPDGTTPSAIPEQGGASDQFTPGVRPLDVAAAAQVSYTKQIRPIFQQHCEECHSGTKPKSGFDVTSVENLLKSGKKSAPTPCVIPTQPDESPMIKYLRGINLPQMPKGEDPISEDELHLLRLWILAGAKDDSAPSEVPPAPASPSPPSSTAPSRRVLSTQNEAGDGDLVSSLIFSPSLADTLVLRRKVRLKLLPTPPASPAVSVPVNNEVDQFVAAKWSECQDGYTPQLCDDATFLRRVYLDIIGAIPTVEQAKAFLSDPAPDRRAKLIDALLARAEDYAANWVPFWEEALCSNGKHQGGVGTRADFRKWILESFKANKAYDVMVAELIDPAMPGHPGRYVLQDNHTRSVQSAAGTAQVFLGTSLKCASCHNHFENPEWTQVRFMSFAGYFAAGDLELVRCEEPTGQSAPTHFIFDLPGAPPDVPATTGARLTRLTQLLVDPMNPRFAKTVVNRIWKRYLGLGLFEPADDFRLDRPASHPELLEWLAHDFMVNGYDLQHTIRLILNSRTYQLAYDPAHEDRYDVSDPKRVRYFRSPTLRRLTAEQVLDSVQVAVNQKWPPESRLYQSEESSPLTRALGRPATRNEVSTARPEDVAVVQALEFMNGEEYNQHIYGGAVVGTLGESLATGGEASGVVTQAYWSALLREPTPAEREAGSAYLRDGVPPQPTPDVKLSVSQVGDLFWGLVSSPEFQYIK